MDTATGRIRPVEEILGKRKVSRGVWLIAPPLFFLVVFLVIPLGLVVILSFMQRGPYGDVVYEFSMGNYTRLLDPLYLRILGYSLSTAAYTTLATLIIGYPLAYVIARSNPGARSLLLFLILVPFWTNFIIRIYAWIMILRTGGLLNSLLLNLGIISTPMNLLYTPTAVFIGMVYEFLPFMVLPLYASLEKIEHEKLEAAADLGARPWRAFMRVTLPLSLPGIIAGTILVFIPAMGMFVVPDLLGGAQTILVGNLIRNQFLTARDWPLGAAASMILLVSTLLLTLLYTRKAGLGEDLLV